jgi:PadR family transcriptional regulator, regulatory protein PadR
MLPLIKGTLDVMVLKALAWTPMHGFEITSWLEARSGALLSIDDSALYQALHRLEERGLIVGEWAMTENNRRARYYKVTPSGKAHLRTESASMVEYARVLTMVLDSPNS